MTTKISNWVSLVANPVRATSKKYRQKITLILFRRQLFFIAEFIKLLPAFLCAIAVLIYLSVNPANTTKAWLQLAVLASKILLAVGVIINAWLNSKKYYLKHQRHLEIRKNRRSNR